MCDPGGATERAGCSFLHVNIGINCLGLMFVWETWQAGSWQKLADGSPCVMSQFCLITMRIGKTKPAKTLACSRDGVNAGSREEAGGCSQVTGDLAPPSLDQQANETHGAGESMFSRPHGTQLSKIDDFFLLLLF